MTTKIEGSSGIEFPDATVQSTAADSGPAFFAAQTGGGQGVPANEDTVVIFTDETFDTDNAFTVGASARFTPQVAGYYQFQWNVMLSSNGAGTMIMTSSLRKNGVGVAKGIQKTVPFTAAGEQETTNGAATIFLNGTTDYADVTVLTVNATSTIAGAAPGVNTYFSGALVRKA